MALYRETVPHRGYNLLRPWGARLLHGSRVFTGNVDGQFQKAGFDQAHIYECLGSIHHLQCLEPCRDEIWIADAFKPDVDENNCQLRNLEPVCPYCGGLARPNVMMFGEWDWIDRRSSEQSIRLDAWLSSATPPIVIELGAGTTIPSVRHFSQRVIHQLGGRLVRINPSECDVPTRLDVGLRMRASEGLAFIAMVLGTE